MEIFDKFTRPMRDLRLSVIDACNFRCMYCMPPDRDYDFFKKEEKLSTEECIRLSKLFVQLGVRRIRITGGEPLLRPDLAEIIDEKPVSVIKFLMTDLGVMASMTQSLDPATCIAVAEGFGKIVGGAEDMDEEL